MARWDHGYVGGHYWLRGNLHAHTTVSDGQYPPDVLCERYHAAGYDFLALTDHDKAPPVAFRSGDIGGMLLIPGVEASKGRHQLSLFQSGLPTGTDQEIIDDSTAAGGLSVLCHPNWRYPEYWPVADIAALRGVTGLEVYNATIERHPGSPFATDLWDRLLVQGHRLWGFADDDFHVDQDFGKGWNVVNVAERSAGAVREAIRRGNFYASSGVEIEQISVEADTVTIQTSNGTRAVLLGPGGEPLAEETGTKATFALPPDRAYVRVEWWSADGRRAWLQPLIATSEAI